MIFTWIAGSFSRFMLPSLPEVVIYWLDNTLSIAQQSVICAVGWLWNLKNTLSVALAWRGKEKDEEA